MRITGILTAPDALSATWLHIKPRKSMAILGLLLIVLALWALFYMFFRSRVEDSSTKWMLVGAMVLLALQFFVLTPMRVKKSFESRSSHRLELTCVPSDKGLTFSNANGTALVPWGDFAKWKESDKLFLLYVAGGLQNVLPKRFFSNAADIEEFRALLADRIRGR